MRDIHEIILELREAYRQAHNANVRFGRFLKRENVKEALAMGEELRKSHSNALRLLDEAVTNVEKDYENLPKVENQAVNQGIQQGLQIVESQDMAFFDLMQLMIIGVAFFMIFASVWTFGKLAFFS